MTLRTKSAPGEALAEYQRKRDFTRTAEPAGGGDAEPSPEGLRFVVQKHAASHLHFDLRLEVDGVMKSWAVPKGPSLDPADKRLAVQVEDHPIAYNTFEGIIPAGEYGGGTVMLWDRGVYLPAAAAEGIDPEAAMRRGLEAGKLEVVFAGERLRGEFHMVRTRQERGKPQWLLFKSSRDQFADPDRDLVAEETTSVESGRTMKQIASGASAVWHSDRSAAAPPAQRLPTSGIEPMYASVGDGVPRGDGWTFEPKYDGIRVLAFTTSGAVVLLTRNGNDKAAQFPEVVEEVRALAAELQRDLVLDGEVVALVGEGIGRFQALQARMHETGKHTIAAHARDAPAALIVFDVLVDGGEVLIGEPWNRRRERLEELLSDGETRHLRLAESGADGAAMLERAEREGWEGVIAKRTRSKYAPGKRSREWLKLKIDHRQEFVVGGWTEPKGSRAHFGALLLGYYDEAGDLIYAGHTGSGFSADTLEQVSKRLKRRARKTPPFAERPKTNTPAHWTTPKVVVEVKFTEWTTDGMLRHPIFLGVRDDRDPQEVRREAESVQDTEKGETKGKTLDPEAKRASLKAPEKATKKPSRLQKKNRGKKASAPSGGEADIVERLRELEAQGGGRLEVERGQVLDVTNLDKTYFPGAGYTKGDLMRYYAGVAPLLVPLMRDRPLVLRRLPNGIDAEPFYQQKAPENVPDGVRVETVDPDSDAPERVVGGNLITLLYTVQLGTIAVNPWHTRVAAMSSADYTILDLDPGPKASFERIVKVALAVREELERLGVHGAVKTSGGRGMHVYVPLKSRTPLDSARLFAELIATHVATRHPKLATVERAVKARAPDAVYVDYLQNIRGKTVAAAYSVREKPGAPVSTPLRWDEVEPGLDPRDFTLETAPERFARIGDVWAAEMAEPVSIRDALALTP